MASAASATVNSPLPASVPANIELRKKPSTSVKEAEPAANLRNQKSESTITTIECLNFKDYKRLDGFLANKLDVAESKEFLVGIQAVKDILDQYFIAKAEGHISLRNASRIFAIGTLNSYYNRLLGNPIDYVSFYRTA